MRVTVNNDCEYEWGVHVSIFGKAAGFTENQIVDICQPKTDPDVWSSSESVIINTVDQLCFSGKLDDNIQIEFQRCCTVEKQLEIFALCGTYLTVSYVANVAGLSLEPFSVQFPNRR